MHSGPMTSIKKIHLGNVFKNLGWKMDLKNENTKKTEIIKKNKAKNGQNYKYGQIN